MRHGALRRSALVIGLVVAATPLGSPAAAQGDSSRMVRLGGDASLTIRGILSSTLFFQDAQFGLGNGQQANFVQTELADWWHGGDIRNMRLTLDFRGPELAPGWRANATFEADFFGGFNGAGAFGDEQPVPRARLAYADLTNGRTTVRIGQAWSLTLGNIPISTSHIGFPLGWGSGGFIGWRFPGVFVMQSFGAPTTPLRGQLQFAVMKNSWSDEAVADQPSAGEAGMPQVEARINFDGRLGAPSAPGATPGSWNAYLVGHWDRKNLNGVRPEGTPEPPDNDLTSTAFQAGARMQSGPLTLHGNAYTGKAMGHHFAHVVQFGDISGWGAWVQGGINLAPRWSLWVYYGMDDPDDDDLPAATSRLGSSLLVPMLRFQAGPYSLGVEWLRNTTEYRLAAGTEDRTGNQLAWSARFDW
jgi:hypothetical protein